MTPLIRPETGSDSAGISAVYDRAFPGPGEARLVEALRKSGGLWNSLVAELDGQIVAHVAFSPVTLTPEPARPLSGVGLAPIGVLPEFQRKGIGSLLIVSGLEACRQAGHEFVVVLGHPEYYPRFGFAPGPPRGLRCVYPVPDEVFMIRELVPGALQGIAGRVDYHPAFAAVE